MKTCVACPCGLLVECADCAACAVVAGLDIDEAILGVIYG